MPGAKNTMENGPHKGRDKDHYMADRNYRHGNVFNIGLNVQSTGKFANTYKTPERPVSKLAKVNDHTDGRLRKKAKQKGKPFSHGKP